MDISLLAFWGLVGWCGTPWPRRWPFPWPPGPDPDPWIAKVIGVAGGILGGLAFGQFTDTSLVIGAIGAWAGSTILSEIVGLAQGGLKR